MAYVDGETLKEKIARLVAVVQHYHEKLAGTGTHVPGQTLRKRDLIALQLKNLIGQSRLVFDRVWVQELQRTAAQHMQFWSEYLFETAQVINILARNHRLSSLMIVLAIQPYAISADSGASFRFTLAHTDLSRSS
jgi:hypothetical protein